VKLPIIITYILLTLPSFSNGQAKSNNTLPEKSINYGIDKSYEPYEYLNNEGEFQGFNIDIIRAIGTELNWNVKIYADRWSIIRNRLEVENELDIAAYFKTSDREKKILFSKPFSLVYYSIFTRSDKNPVEDLFSLSGKKVAIQEASIIEEYFDQIGFLDLKELKTYASESDAIDAVVKGEADCAITSFMTTNYKMESENITNVQSSSDPVFITEYCFVANKNDSLLLDSLNWGLRLIKASGEYDRIYQKWLSPNVSWWEKNKELVNIISLVILVLILLAMLYIYSLQKLIQKKSILIEKEIEIRNKAELELIESENLRKKIEDFTSVMLIETDLENHIVRASSLFYSIIGFKEEEILGVNIHQLMSIESSKKDKEIKNLILNKEVVFLDAEYEFKTNTSTTSFFASSTSLQYDKNKRIVGYKQFMQDITPLMQANLNLKDMNAELSNFMYKTSHDVRGPIANVLGLVSLGQMTTDNLEVVNYFKLINKSIQKLERIFNDFKEVSFILHGDVNITTFDFEELINEVMESVFLKRNKDLKRAQIKIEILSDSNFISSDRALIKRLFFQLIENVFEHNNYYDTKLSITFEKENSSIYRFCFNDNGVGIPEEMQKKVFEVFFKGKRSDVNIGMGLYMAKKVVFRLNGELNILNKEDKGTLIEVVIPVNSYSDAVSLN